MLRHLRDLRIYVGLCNRHEVSRGRDARFSPAIDIAPMERWLIVPQRDDRRDAAGCRDFNRRRNNVRHARLRARDCRRPLDVVH